MIIIVYKLYYITINYNCYMYNHYLALLLDSKTSTSIFYNINHNYNEHHSFYVFKYILDCFLKLEFLNHHV